MLATATDVGSLAAAPSTIVSASPSLVIEPRAGAPFPVEAHRARDEALDVAFTGGPLFYEAEAAGVSHLLISAGCPYFCSFCKESW
ncbi:MAG TPA: hypothetical protein P5061_10210, partial [Mycobacterium sp.]|nr:hypothetical protein [Mycobacterium sp.]